MAHDAMTGDGDSEGVCCTRLRHRAHGVRGTKALGDVRVARRRADRDGAQCLPDPLLEGRAPHIEGQIEPERRGLDEAYHPGYHVFKVCVTAEQLCHGEAVLKIAHQRLGIIAEQDGADAPGSGSDKDRTQRAFADGKAYRYSIAASAGSSSCHAQYLRGRRIETSISIEPRAIDRFRHRVRPGQFVSHPLCTVHSRIAIQGQGPS